MSAGRGAAQDPRQNVEHTAIAIVDQFLDAADKLRASDIHVEPQGDKLLIRFRVDGRLQLWRDLPVSLHAQVISRLKIISGMDISEKRLPQDGRFTNRVGDGTRDYRIATVPMVEGEKAVIRILMQNLSKIDFRSIGYSDWNLKMYEELLNKPHGLLLHCGPTGSGKTTALYAAVNYLNESWRNIQTVEDPVEGRLVGVNQAQVNAEIGLTFARVLRGLLRQDCNIILIGEIRDPETAQLALQASLTGHLVLGTLHTNSATGAVARLIDIGVPAFFVGTGLGGAVSQRLVRRLCRACRRAYRPPPDIAQQYGLPPEQPLYQAVGCHDCGGSGYKGRIGIQEVLPITPQLREAICANQPEQALQKVALHAGMVNIFRDGLMKALAGHTTIEEVYRAVAAERA
jgi:type IV pilus assembly protein PilB